MNEQEMAASLAALLAEDQVMSGDAVKRAYDCDAYTVERRFPDVVVYPKSTEEVANVVRWCIQNSIPYTPRGAGTGLSGGALPACGGVVVALTKMRKILEVDAENRIMLAEAGCPNLALSKAAAQFGLHFAPDPSSQTVCSLGGNISENSGGPHTLKYGVTTDHILSVKMVDGEGNIREFGGKIAGSPGYDLVGLVVGSEGTLGIVTEAWIRLTPVPTKIRTLLAAFSTPIEATQTVSDIIAAGIIPAAMEFMDQTILQAVEAAFHTGLPTEAGALLLIECDGENADAEIAIVERIANNRNAIQERIAKDEEERAALWTARKKSIGAVGRIAASMVTHDGVIPRSRLPEVLEFVYATAKEYGLRVANIFHAGDGNLHPIFLFDDRNEDEVDRVVRAGEAVIRKCIEEGGSVTGEHGIGVEKIDLLGEMFTPEDLRLQGDVRRAFLPSDLCNPGKVLPTQKACVEVRVKRRAAH
jgi:glycolate oxidase